jgi:hypothetical protein
VGDDRVGLPGDENGVVEKGRRREHRGTRGRAGAGCAAAQRVERVAQDGMGLAPQTSMIRAGRFEIPRDLRRKGRGSCRVRSIR